MSNILLRLEGVSLSYANTPVLKGIDLKIRKGEIISLIGPNGAGKTSLVRVITGLIPVREGVRWVSYNLCIGYVPQRIHIIPSLPLTVRRFITLTRRFSYKEIKEGLPLVGLNESILERAIQAVSGGELQRVLLLRAVLRKPQLLVLDEPAQGVDPNGQQSLYRLIRQIRDDTGCAVLMVSHDLHLVMAATDSVICLNGHICCSGHPERISRDPNYLKIFGSVAPELVLYKHHHDHEHNSYEKE